MSNSVFMHGDPFWANACVGENGFVDYLTYADGYSKASNLLLDYVLNNDGNDIDSFIYPICFNMRHSIELRMKGAIDNLRELAKIKNKTLDNFNLAKSHDILNIWIYYKEKSELLDYRFESINKLLNQTVLDIGEIDSTGQVFRYPFDDSNQKHLIKVSNINCVVLKTKFNELETYLGRLDRVIKLLIEEYKVGTFTSKFTRSQIFNLSKTLPKYESWSTELKKTEICNKYNISSNDLSKILNLIKTNYEMSGFIEFKLNLIVLNNSSLMNLCETWLGNIRPDLVALYNGKIEVISLEDTVTVAKNFEKSKLREETYKNLSLNLNVDIIADLWALFYLSREKEKYSEMYLFLFDTFREEIMAENNLIQSFKHIFSKSSFLEQILKSLYFLQQIELADTIVNTLNLDSCFKFIEKARDRSLFKKWENSDYSL